MSIFPMRTLWRNNPVVSAVSATYNPTVIHAIASASIRELSQRASSSFSSSFSSTFSSSYREIGKRKG